MSDRGAGARDGSPSAGRPVLVVEHEAQCPPAWFGDWMLDAGAQLDVRQPWRGEALPESLTGHAGLLVLGGSMGAGDDADHPWLPATRALLRQASDAGVPTLGICLGHQLLARATGGRIDRHVAGRHCALSPVGWTAEAPADPLFGPLATSWPDYDEAVAVHWNVDVVSSPPPGAVALAYASNGSLQVMRVAPAAWGIQSHPEVGARILAEWAADEPPEDTRAHALVAAAEAAEPRLRAAWQPLAVGFAEMCRRFATAAPGAA